MTLRMLAARFSGVAAVALALTAVPVPVAGADDCADVDVTFARGTAEPPGLGRVGDALVGTLSGLIAPRSVSSYAVNYPASYNFLSTRNGADDAAAHIRWMTEQCPGTRLVLGGFSQGAAAVSMLAGVPPVGDRIGTIGSAGPLPPDLAANVPAVAVFGNPGARFGSPLSTTGQFAGRTIDLCSGGDPICSSGRDRAAHSNYELPPYPDQAARFIAARI